MIETDVNVTDTPITPGPRKYLKAMAVPSLMTIILITKFLGVWKYRAISSMFGTGHEMNSHVLDIFWAAFNFPDIVFNVLVAGSVNAALIPIFADTRAKGGDKDLVKIVSQFTMVLSVALIFISLLIYAFAPQISHAMISGGSFSQFLDVKADSFTVADIDLLTKLMRIMLLSPILLGFSSIITGYLQVYKRFVITAIAPFLYSAGMVFGAYFFVKYLGWGIEGLSWSVILGSALHLLIQLPDLINLFRKFSDDILEVFKDFNFKTIKYIVRISLPKSVALFGEQLNILINTVLGFNVVTGGLSAYKNAFALHLVPAQIITGSISIMALPELSEMYAKKDYDGFKRLYNRSLQESVFLILPFVAVFAVLRMPIVRLIFGTGKFDWWSTVFTSWVLIILSYAMLAQVLAAVTLRAYYAIHDTKSPLIHTYASVVVNLIFTYLFLNFFSHYSDWRPLVGSMFNDLTQHGFFGIFDLGKDFGGDLLRWFSTRGGSDYAIGGIAVGYTVSYLFEAFLNMAFINPKIKIVTWKDTISPILLKFGIAMISGLAMYLVYRSTDKLLDTSRVIDVVYVLVISSFSGGFLYLLLSYLLRVQEFRFYTNKVEHIIVNYYGRFQERFKK